MAGVFSILSLPLREGFHGVIEDQHAESEGETLPDTERASGSRRVQRVVCDVEELTALSPGAALPP